MAGFLFWVDYWSRISEQISDIEQYRIFVSLCQAYEIFVPDMHGYPDLYKSALFPEAQKLISKG